MHSRVVLVCRKCTVCKTAAHQAAPHKHSPCLSLPKEAHLRVPPRSHLRCHLHQEPHLHLPPEIPHLSGPAKHHRILSADFEPAPCQSRIGNWQPTGQASLLDPEPVTMALWLTPDAQDQHRHLPNRPGISSRRESYARRLQSWQYKMCNSICGS